MPLFVLAGWLMLGFIYVNTMAVMNRRVDQGLAAERRRLEEDLEGVPPQELPQRIRERITAERGSARLYLLLPPGDGTANVEVEAAALPRPGAYGSARVVRRGGHSIEARLLGVPLPHGRELVIGRDLSEQGGFLVIIEESLGAGVLLTLLLGTAAGLLGSAGVVRRLAVVNATTRKILQGNFGERVPVHGTAEEFDELARHINAMLDRIEALMAAMRDVTDNIAHELRTPLNRLRGRMELAMLEGVGRCQVDAILQSCLDDTDALLATFEALLTIARLDNALVRDFQSIDVAVLVEDLVDYYAPLAEEKAISLSLGPVAPVAVPGDRHLLFQALANLMDNAIKYTPSGGRIAVSVTTAGDQAAITVGDDGPGIPEARRGRVRERFVRLDPSPQTPGTGLGLSVVEAVARHHGGALELADNHPGLRATLRLPLAVQET